MSIKSATFSTIFSGFKPLNPVGQKDFPEEKNTTSPPCSPPAPPSSPASPAAASSWKSPALQQQQQQLLFSPALLLQQQPLSSPPPFARLAGAAAGPLSAPGPAEQNLVKDETRYERENMAVECSCKARVSEEYCLTVSHIILRKI